MQTRIVTAKRFMREILGLFVGGLIWRRKFNRETQDGQEKAHFISRYSSEILAKML